MIDLAGAAYAAVVGSLRAGLMVLIRCVCIAGVAYWLVSPHGVARALAAAGASAAVVLLMAPLEIFWCALRVAASEVQRRRIASGVLTSAVRRAEAIDPRLGEKNDFGAFTRSINDAFDSLVADPIEPPRRRFFGAALLVRRMANRIIRVVGRITLQQLELHRRPDGSVPYATMHEWLGAQIDAWTGETLRKPARWLWPLLALQVLVCAGIVIAAGV